MNLEFVIDSGTVLLIFLHDLNVFL